jgi:DNA-binding IclR family transcriptional regulator
MSAANVRTAARKPAERPGPGGIQVIARIAEILRTLGTAPGGMTQAELCEQIGLARSTVHRLLTAMRDEGLVETSGPRGRYRLGPAIRRLADAAWRSGPGGLQSAPAKDEPA